MEARAQADSRLERERRRLGDRVYGRVFVESYPKRTQLATMVADCIVAMETQMGAIQGWAESMERRMERGETYADDVEVVSVYTAKEMLKAMTDEVASVSRASEGRAVTLETIVKGEYVSVSVAARGDLGGNDVARGTGRVWDSLVDGDPGPMEVARCGGVRQPVRMGNNPPPSYRTMKGRRADGPYHPGCRDGRPMGNRMGNDGGGEAKMDCRGKRGGKRKR